MKEHLLHLILLLLAFTVTPTLRAGETITVDGINYNYTSTDGEIEVGNNPNFEGECVIPEKIVLSGKTLKVVGISKIAFYYCTGILSVSIPNSVRYISYGAFRGCSNLESIEWGSSVNSIGENAFADCTSLTGNLTIPPLVERISEGTFAGAPLSKVVIPASVGSIGVNAFTNTKELYIEDAETDISLEGITHKGYDVAGCMRSLSKLYVGRNIVYAKYGYDEYSDIYEVPQFFEAKNLEYVTLGPKVTYCSPKLFWRCRNLKKMILSKNMDSFTRVIYEAKCDTLVVKRVMNENLTRDVIDATSNCIITRCSNTIHTSSYNHYNDECKLKWGDFTGNVLTCDNSVNFETVRGYLKGYSFKIVPNPYWDSYETSEAAISAGEGWSFPAPDADGVYFVDGLEIDTSYGLSMNWTKNGTQNETESYIWNFATSYPQINLDASSTQSTIIIHSISPLDDITCKAEDSIRIKYYNWDNVNEVQVEEEAEYKGGELTLTNLQPGVEVFFRIYCIIMEHLMKSVIVNGHNL